MAKPWSMRFGWGDRMGNIAGCSFATCPCATKKETSSNGTEPASILKIASGPKQALIRSEAYLAEAQRLSRTGSFAYNPGIRTTVFWSEELFRIFRLDPQGGIPSYDETRQLVHPEDRDRVSQECLQGFREKADFSQSTGCCCAMDGKAPPCDLASGS